ncbi:ABC transporter ATP-binding protein [Halobacteriales archaeon QH_8_68_33]|nr:MAG: ABC transporter ATP-binding protein [Halobacteriales archaeon QH_8_68_33]
MTATLVAEDLRRAYGETVALDGVSLSVDEGEVFALVGPNGAGKTTLVRALTGTTDAEGSVTLFGADLRDVDPERVGLLPQDFDPPERLTARELLAYYGGLYDDARDTERVLDDVGLREAADTWYENLSGGQRRRVCVGTALVNDPDLLFLDEPTTGIDPAGRRALWRLVEDLAAGGTTVVLTTHYMTEAHRLGDRVGLLADGRLVAVDDPDALVAEYGGDPRLVVETDADPADLDLPSNVDPGRVERGKGTLTVRGIAPGDIGGVVNALDRAGVTYESLTWTEPDLEDVYLELTGADEAGTVPAGGPGEASLTETVQGGDA